MHARPRWGLARHLTAAGLLLCTGCATPFPFERLEAGMTPEAVRDALGPPGETSEPDASWTYHDEEQLWVTSVFFSTVFLPHSVVLTGIGALANALTEPPEYVYDWMYVRRRPVVLHFEDERLARWETLEWIDSMPSGDYAPDSSWWQDQMWREHQRWIERVIEQKERRRRGC